MTVDEVSRLLRAYKTRGAVPDAVDFRKEIILLKTDAVSKGLETEAKELWILETTLLAQSQYLKAFGYLGDKAFYDAWCIFEQCEITLGFLERHETARWVSFGLNFIGESVKKWQSLFPYKVFFSPEIIEIEKKCSICGELVRPRTGCKHRLGDIYAGTMCCHIVTQMEPISISIVENPVQKYSVAFIIDPKSKEKTDHYNYSLVQYARSVILEPFQPWSVELTTKLWPHTYYRHIGRNEACPCGSRKKYKKCCALQNGVSMPHHLIHLSTSPPVDVPTALLSQVSPTSLKRR